MKYANTYVECGHSVNFQGSVRDCFRLLSLLGAVAFSGATEGLAQGTAEKPSLTSAAAVPSDLSECIKKLNLTDKQDVQVKEIADKYDAAIKSVWQQFSEKYMQTIVAETTLMAAVEDGLTEEQRNRIRQQRRKLAQHEKLIEAHSGGSSRETSKPIEGVGDELAETGVTLTEEQEELADKLQEKYRPQLRALNREIQGLHARLLSLEADKLVSIEKVLTKEQLMQLREIRKAGPAVTKRGARRSDEK